MTMGESPFKDVPIDVFMEKIRDGAHPGKPYNCPEDIYWIMEECWSLFPNDRPSWSDLADQLHKLCASKYSLG